MARAREKQVVLLGLSCDVSGVPSSPGRAGPEEHHQQKGRLRFPSGPSVQVWALHPHAQSVSRSPCSPVGRVGWARAHLGWCRRGAEGRTQ